MMLLAQIDHATEVVNHAITESGWAAGLLVLIVLAALGLFGFLIRGDRSELREINRFVRTEMPDVIDGNTLITARFIAVLHTRPCIHDSDVDKFEAIDSKTLREGEVNELDGVAKKAADRIKRRAARRVRVDEDSNT